MEHYLATKTNKNLIICNTDTVRDHYVKENNSGKQKGEPFDRTHL